MSQEPAQTPIPNPQEGNRPYARLTGGWRIRRMRHTTLWIPMVAFLLEPSLSPARERATAEARKRPLVSKEWCVSCDVSSTLLLAVRMVDFLPGDWGLGFGPAPGSSVSCR